MTRQQVFRMSVDCSMTILSIVLMGGNFIFQATSVHEILGTLLFPIWAIHIFLNRLWYASLFKGKYNSYRIMQSIINCGILICVIFLVISGIMLSHHVFAFLGINFGIGFARLSHLMSSHWYLLFMSLHIGLHINLIANRILSKRNVRIENQKKFSPSKVILAIVCIYGTYAFISRGIWKYLILKQHFFFMNIEKGLILFFVDYVAIIVLFATLAHFTAKALKWQKKTD
ncbi:DUF4405 domain-containing protein [uncultured Treponema sp.]|uniref:DUF4405 domain-containing protein n=1 Tax=uncultured Treponema sp. TaxID=162155 RepID=UPI0025EE055F|nr:DUF4405 domain-containing protein [uncultured Treponema sp.]